MNGLTYLVVLAAAMVAAISAQPPPASGYPGGSGPSPGYSEGGPRGYSQPAPSYGGYPSSPRTYGRRNRYPPPPPPPRDETLDDLHKLYSRLESVLAQVKTAEEQLSSLEARLSIQKKYFERFITVIYVQILETDTQQNYRLAQLEATIDSVYHQITVDLHDHIDALYELNENNTVVQEHVENIVDREHAREVRQQRQIITVYSLVKDLKEKLLQVKDNHFETLFDTIERVAGELTSVKSFARRRMCEVGQATLTAIDQVKEYNYQTLFENVPQIIYGICGFDFNLNSRDDPISFSYGYAPPSEPNAIGVRVNGYSSTSAINLEVFDLSFGDTSLETVDVCFQACSIGPGIGPVTH